MLKKKDIRKIAMLGILGGLCTASSPLMAIQGTEMARGACGKSGCNKKTGKTSFSTSSYESSSNSEISESNASLKEDKTEEKTK